MSENAKQPSTVESLAAEKGTPDWLVAAMRAKYRWGEGKEISAGDFDKAVELTGNLKFHAHDPGPAPETAVVTQATASPAATPTEWGGGVAAPEPTAAPVVDDRPLRKR